MKLKDYEKSGFIPQEGEEMGQTYGSMAAKCGYKAEDTDEYCRFSRSTAIIKET